MIHIICALKCEALPLVEHYQLQHLTSAELFRIYTNESSGISVTITGVGKLAAAAGTMHTIKHLQARDTDAWINIGIAGHISLATGTAVLANRIVDAASEQVWQPQITMETLLPQTGLETLDKPSTAYKTDMYDMEAAGFYASASLLAASDRVMCLKIISDNNEDPAEKISAAFVSELINNKLEEITKLAEQLATLITSSSGAGHSEKA